MSAVPPGAEWLTLAAAIERAASTNGVPDAAAIYVIGNKVRASAEAVPTVADAVLSLALHRLAPVLAGIGARPDLRAEMQARANEAIRTGDPSLTAARRKGIVETALRELVTPRARRDSAQIPLPLVALLGRSWFG